MKGLNKKTILPYLKKHVFPHLNFITYGKLQNFKEVTGGLVSRVFRLVIDNTPFYLKQVIPGSQKYLKFIKAPKYFNYIFNDQRQIYEANALRIFEKAVGYGVAPHIYYHDVRNKILIISEVLDKNAQLFENTISKKINLYASKELAKIAVKLVNNTYGKTRPLRSVAGDRKVKLAKLRFQCLDVYSRLDNKYKNLVKNAQIKLVQESMKINKVLVHGDYHPRNILVDGDRVGTVDLEEAHLGDPAFDIGILIGSYLLRADYHENIRNQAIRSVQEMVKIYFENLKVPENKKRLENRIKKHAGGLILSRIDGLSSKWTFWFKKESVKKSIRKHATELILDDSTPLSQLIEKIYQ